MSKNIEEVSYCIGMNIAGSLMQQELEQIDPKKLTEAIEDVFKGNTPKYSVEQASSIIQNYIEDLNKNKFEKHKIEGDNFLNENKNKSGVFETATGLQYEIVKEGEGNKPSNIDVVKVHYHGTLIDGTVFDSSFERGTPATFGVNQVIKGWTEALQLMNVGSTYRLYIPQDLAYGSQPHPGGPIKPYMTLIFDVELIDIIK